MKELLVGMSPLLGGMALFVYGMNGMSEGLRKAAGDRLRYVLGAVTRNTLFGVAAGAVTTAVLQSSSATICMAVSFTSAGLIGLPQAIAIIFGANIGTTMTAQLLAFEIEEYIHQCPKDVLAARELMLSLHESGLRFDAVLTSDDTLAVGAVKYAHITGRNIPDDLSIVGYNNSSYAVCTDPELTSIDSKVEALCTTTINTLMGVFNGGNVPVRTTIAADLIKRATTKF